MPKLIALGCSNTYGHGLPDVTFPNGMLISPLRKPSNLAWPQKLADLLGYKCVNISRPASSNKLIAYRLLEQEIDEDDIVVFLWSFLLRTCIVDDAALPHEPLDERVKYLHRWAANTNQKSAQAWIKWRAKYANENDLAIENMSWLATGNHYANLHTKNVYNYTMNDRALMPYADRFKINIIQDFSKLAYKMPKALDRQHPGEEAHTEMAKFMHRKILERYHK